MASGRLTYEAEHDWLRISLVAGQAYSIELTGLSEFVGLDVGTAGALDEGFEAIGTTISGAATGTTGTSIAFFRAVSSGTYYVDVSDLNGPGSYTVSAAPVTTTFTNDTSTTGAVAIGGSTAGSLTAIGEHDWLAVSLVAGQAYSFSVSGLSDGVGLKISTATELDAEMNSIGSTFAGELNGTTATSTAFFRPDTSGTYYIDVSDENGPGNYTVSAQAINTAYTDNTSTAGAVTVDGSATGTLTAIGEHDWLAVSLVAGQAYSITATGSNSIELFVGTAGELDQGPESIGTIPIGGEATTTATSTAFFRPDTTGTYYVDVSEANGIGSYTVSASSVTTTYTNDTSTTGSVTIGGSTTGSLTTIGEHDWLAVSLTAGQAYSFSLTGLSEFSALEVGTVSELDEGAESVGSTIAGQAEGASSTTTVFFRPDASGTYYIDVSDANGPGNYTVSASAVSTTFTNDTSTTGSVAVGSSTTGSLTTIGEHDWLAVSLVAGQAYSISVTGLSDFVGLEIGTAANLDEGVESGGLPASTEAAGSTATSTAFFRPDASGTYYIDVSDENGPGTYTVSVSADVTVYTNDSSTIGTVAVACYARGTHILTDKGERRVEDLKIDDRVISYSGAIKPIRWIGRRSYAGRFLAANPMIQPIRFRRGALGSGLPRQDLFVSPKHAMLLDGMLVPAECLVNGATVTRSDCLTAVEYFHIELDEHDVLLAEGAPSESFVDDDNRGMFHNAAEWSASNLNHGHRPAEYCARRVEHGYELEAIRCRLAMVASAMKLAA